MLHKISLPIFPLATQICHFLEKDIMPERKLTETPPRSKNPVYLHHTHYPPPLTSINLSKSGFLAAPLLTRRHTAPRPARVKTFLHFHFGGLELHPCWDARAQTSLIRGLATISDPNKNSIPAGLMMVRAPPHLRKASRGFESQTSASFFRATKALPLFNFHVANNDRTRLAENCKACKARRKLSRFVHRFFLFSLQFILCQKLDTAELGRGSDEN